MANFPNKIFSLKESSLFYMLEIKKHLSKNDFDVWVLYNIMKESISLADYIEVLVCLYAPMLKEIYCDKFKKKLIEFHDGLNIILGDDIASNSIGKSTMLLAIDFAFGGDTYAKQDNIIRNVKHHTLKFKFHFNNEDFYYSRSTDSQNIVTVCDKFWNKQYEITNDEYTNLLKAKYVSSDLLLSFRELLGTYTRIYGKQNCNENHPLHIVPNEKMSLIINRILKLFEVYNQVEDQEKTINSKDEQLKAYKTASQAEIIPTLKNKKEKNDSNEKTNSITIR